MDAPDILEEILAHHGIKGQKWGVRRARNRSSDVSVVDKKKKLKTYGGKGRPAHSDAVIARTSGQIAKKSGPKALSNAELRAFNERLNLEQNYRRLAENDKSRGRQMVNKMIGRHAPKAIDVGVKTGMKTKPAKHLMKKGAKAMAFAMA
jgi:hypothetical protein